MSRQMISVQALDGRWHFGPSSMEQQMRSAPRGAFCGRRDTASARSSIEDPDATSLATKQTTKEKA